MANEQIIRKNIKNIDSTTNQTILQTRFENSLNAVNNLFQNQPPVYATWIRFQIGKSNPLIFDSSSTSTQENVIASLSVNQNGSGTANNFILTVQYDPFKYGQTPSDKLEQLDYIVSEALQLDWNSDLNKLRGTVQYGYSGLDNDTNMISPSYEFFLVKAESNTNFSTGIITYTFEGVSMLGMYCDVTANTGECNGWGLMDLVCWHLYYYFGDYNNRPRNYGSDTYPVSYSPGYVIDIPDELFEDQITLSEVPAQNDVSIYNYCLNYLQQNPLTQSEIDSGNYDNMDQLSYRERPRNIMYITDEEGVKTIHIRHIVPKEQKDTDMLNFVFTWGDQKSNLIKEWNPDVDLYVYLTQRCAVKAQQAVFEQSLSDALQELEQRKGSFETVITYSNPVPTPGKTTSIVKKIITPESQYNYEKQQIIDEYQKKVLDIPKEPQEFYTAEIVLQGIPADPPIGSAITIKPKVLESTSRTAGIYYITGCTSEINNDGKFSTTLQLMRMRGLNEATYQSSALLAAKREQEKDEYTNSNNSTSAIASTEVIVPSQDIPTSDNPAIPNYRQPIKNPLLNSNNQWKLVQ